MSPTGYTRVRFTADSHERSADSFVTVCRWIRWAVTKEDLPSILMRASTRRHRDEARGIRCFAERPESRSGRREGGPLFLTNGNVLTEGDAQYRAAQWIRRCCDPSYQVLVGQHTRIRSEARATAARWGSAVVS